MSLPDGVTTCLLTYGPITDTFGNPADSIEVEVVADRTIVHAASGRTMFKNPVSATAAGNVSVQIPVPHTDQPGFRGLQQNALTGWYYTVKMTARFPGSRVQKDTKTFQPVIGQTEVDADLLESPGMVVPGSSAPTTYVVDPGGGTDGQVLVKQGGVVAWGDGGGGGGYTPPVGGIPKADLSAAVQDSLNEADAAAQDTGWRTLAAGYVAARPSVETKLRRLGSTVTAVVFADLPSNYDIPGAIPAGFRPAVPSLSTAPFISLPLVRVADGNVGVDALVFAASGDIEISFDSKIGSVYRQTFTWLTDDDWPAVLPGEPSDP